MAKEKNDLKKEDDSSEENGQSENESLEKTLNLEENEDSSKENDVDSLPSWAKERLVKAERDRDNYKEGLLKTKKEEKDKKEEESEDDEKSEEDAPDIEKVATEAAEKVITRTHEKEAVSQFLNKYPAYRNNDEWKKLILNLPSNFDKSSPENISKVLEGARLMKNHLEGKTEEESKADMSAFQAISQSGSSRSFSGDANAPKESTVEMGKHFKHSADELKNEDDSPFAEIRI
jgi:hypothetical protein